jgi:cell division protein FtsN
MTKDYKARPGAPRARRRGGGSGFFWFVTGAVMGGFGVGLAWMLDERQVTANAPVAQAAVAAAPAKPSFQFYDILPELEVVVPNDELGPLPKAKPATPTPPPEPVAQVKPAPTTSAEDTPAGSYLLQVASFRTAADAERLKAQLALKGIQTQVQQVTINGKDTYHRVRAGPFRGKQAVNQARSQLASNGFEPIAIKVK